MKTFKLRSCTVLSFGFALATVFGGTPSAQALEPAEVFTRAAPATVVIVALSGAGESGVSLGSGAIVNTAGTVVTNYHVVQPGLRTGQIVAFLYNPSERTTEENFGEYLRTHKAQARPLTVRRLDQENDLALLTLPEGIPYPSIPLGNSETLKVGEPLLAIGTPHGLTWSLTTGLVSSLRRTSIQTSAPINPGNSGGPLLDSAGRLVGVNTYIRDGQALGFARPASMVAGLLNGTQGVAIAPPAGRAPAVFGAPSQGAPSQAAPGIGTPSKAAAAEIPWRPGRFMSEAVANVLRNTQEVSSRSRYGFDEDVSVLGAFLKPSAQVSFNRHFEAGKDYVLLGGGDNSAKDVDIEIRDSDGDLVAMDRDDDATPAVMFTPAKGGNYTFTLRLENSPSGSFCALTIMSHGGYTVPTANLAKALTGVLLHGAIVDQKTGARFHMEDNQWSLFGTILAPGAALRLNQLHMETSGHTILAAADDNSSDVDLYLYDEADDLVGKDEDEDATPMISGRTKEGNYGLRIKNTASKGPSLVIATILDVGR